MVKLVPSVVSAEGPASTLVPLLETIVIAVFGSAPIVVVVDPIVA